MGCPTAYLKSSQAFIPYSLLAYNQYVLLTNSSFQQPPKPFPNSESSIATWTEIGRRSVAAERSYPNDFCASFAFAKQRLTDSRWLKVPSLGTFDKKSKIRSCKGRKTDCVQGSTNANTRIFPAASVFRDNFPVIGSLGEGLINSFTVLRPWRSATGTAYEEYTARYPSRIFRNPV